MPASSQSIPHPCSTPLPQPLPSSFPGFYGHFRGWKIPAGLRRRSLLPHGAVNLGGEHKQTLTAADFHKRKTLGRSNDSQLADLTEEEHPCICGKEREREKTLLCHSWGFTCTKTSQAEDLGHSCSIPANAAQVGSSREQKDRISLGKGQAVKAGLDSFSPLPARATRPTQETTSTSKIPADGEEKITP